MKRTLKRILLAALFALAGGGAQAQIIDSGSRIPDAYILKDFAGSGLDWVYAGPIAPNESALGLMRPADYRAAEGWRSATPGEWAAHPLWSDFIAPGNPGGIVAPTSFHAHSHYIYASEYWSECRHIDAQDFAAGRLTDGVNGPSSGGPETIYVRMTGVVPEPGAGAMLLLGLAGLALLRRRKSLFQ